MDQEKEVKTGEEAELLQEILFLVQLVDFYSILII
jgi:hypothetical protein